MTNTQVLLKDLIQLEYEDDSNGFTTIEDFFEFFSAKTVLKSYTQIRIYLNIVAIFMKFIIL